MQWFLMLLENGNLDKRSSSCTLLSKKIKKRQKETLKSLLNIKRRLTIQTIKRPTFADFRNKALQNKEVRKEYDALKSLFAIKKQLVAARRAKGITQDEIAKKIGTSKSNISRLESLNNTYMPNLATLMKYAQALGMRLDIGLR